MDQKFMVNLDLDLTPPEMGESREAVIRRCADTIDGIRMVIPVLTQLPDLRLRINEFLESMERFLKPVLPPAFERFMKSWNAEHRGPAA